MRNRRSSFLRIFAVFAVLISMVGSLSLPAMAAPVNTSAPELSANQVIIDTQLCIDLAVLGVIDAETGVSLYASIDEILADDSLDQDEVALFEDFELLAGINGECSFVEQGPAEGFLTVMVTDADGTALPGATVTFDTIAEGGAVNPDGSFTTGTTYAPGTYTFTASAEGYEALAGSITVVDGNAGTTVNLVALPPVAADGFMTVFVLDADGAVIPGATVAFDGIPESGTVNPDGTYTTTTTYAPGTYTFTASADGYDVVAGSITVVDGNASTTVNLVALPADGFLTVIVLDADGAPIEGAFVSFDDIGEEGTVFPNDGSFTTSTTYAPGIYTFTVTAEGYETLTGSVEVVDSNASSTVTLVPTAVEPVPATLSAELCVAIGADEDGIVVQADIDAAIIAGLLDPVVDAELIVSLLDGACAEFVAPPVETTGLVYVTKVYCEDLDEVVFNGDDDDDCALGAATFSFYLIGDGTADYQQLEVWEDGFGAIELEAGSYEVVEEGTLATTTIDVVAGEVTGLTVANPGEAPAPRDGTVNISIFTCNNIDEVIFTSDGFMVMALPTFEPACEPGAATLTFYLVGDGTDDFTQIDVDGTGSLVLAPGTYEVVEEGTQASTFITVFAGDFITLDIQIPAGGEVVPGSSVNVVKFYCDTVTETEFLAMNSVEYSDRDELAGAPDCVSGYATFTFYLYGDGTDDYAQLAVNGSGTIGLEPGLYEVVEEETQARFDLEVLDGENTFLFVNNPMPEDGEVPDGSDDGDDDADHGDDKDADTGKTDVTKLPSTGSGMTDGSGLLMIAAAAAAAISGAGALTLRNKR